ncbi:phytanoyl-CoA dioxygenase family protein [Aspergillus phoenicis ATCC 13157]|uniref:Phytanoyl-CoA dioxygenase family protein n=1 Tax=Aspergillus phoenicis ATCC 13157 TaxID=1353007 RepID=A0A370PQI5_ASPPH|nr:phytanoyl-CoA dioxygenase family protein [Aspergillus phoenicis ATCC 13157]
MSPPSLSIPATPTVAETLHLWKKRFDKRHLSTNPVIATLDIEYNELVQSWKRFQDNLLPNDRVLFHERLQNPDDVLDVVASIEPVWTSTSGQRVLRECCDEFRSTLGSHGRLLAVLPRNELYCSLFYGVLQSLLKASAGYPRILEGLFKALVQINRLIAPPALGEAVPATKDSINAISRFYTLLFFFLGEVMDWYVRKAKCGLLRSPNQDVYRAFQRLIGQIRRSAKSMMHDLTDAMDVDDADCDSLCEMAHDDYRGWFERARLSQVGLQNGARRFAAQNALTRQLMWEIHQDAVERKRLLQDREVLLARLLDTVSLQLQSVSRQNSGIACLTTTASQDLDTDRFNLMKGGHKHKYTRMELQMASQKLEDFFDADDQIPALEFDVPVIAEDNVMTSLKQWATDAHSQVLAVGGPQSTVYPSPVLLVSTCYASFARKEGLPVISHFCNRSTDAANKLTYEQHLIALAYSLIRQLIEYLPPVVESHAGCDLSGERFKPLNGTLTSWKEVLSLIDILLHFAPPLLVCVIHGLDIIQDASTDPYIRSLVRTFLTHTRHQPVLLPNGEQSQSVLLKVLFTVAGRPSSLVETLSENQLILRESNTTEELAPTDAALDADVGPPVMIA